MINPNVTNKNEIIIADLLESIVISVASLKIEKSDESLAISKRGSDCLTQPIFATPDQVNEFMNRFRKYR